MDPSLRVSEAAVPRRAPTGRRGAAVSLFLAGLTVGLMLGLAQPPSLHAQTPDPPQDPEADSLRDEFRLPVPPAPEAYLPIYRAVPAMSANSPTGYGAQWGDFFAGAAYQTRARYVDGDDGSIAAGLGLGNPRTLVGVEVVVISFSTFRSGWGRRVGVDFKVHRVLPGTVGLAVGWESALLRGRTDSRRSRYLAASRWFQLKDDDSAPFSAIVLSGGVGNERFVPWDAEGNQRSWGLFGSVGVRVLEPLSFVVDWTGQDLAIATSLAPFDTQWLVFSAGLMDLTGRVGDGTRLVLTGSYLYRMGAP